VTSSPRHRTLTITREGGTVVTIPLAPRTARAIGLATGERGNGPISTRLAAKPPAEDRWPVAHPPRR